MVEVQVLEEDQEKDMVMATVGSQALKEEWDSKVVEVMVVSVELEEEEEEDLWVPEVRLLLRVAVVARASAEVARAPV